MGWIIRNGSPVHIYRGSGIYCFNCADFTEYEYESKYKLVCPKCGDIFELEPTLWDLVKDLREAKNLTMAELARRIGSSRSTIYRIENRRVIPKLDTVLKLAKALEADKDLFLKKLEEIREANK